MEISLTPELNAFARRLLESGSFSSESEVVKAALRMLEQETNQCELLRVQMAEARAEFDRGEVVRESATFWDDLRREAAARAIRDMA